MSEVAKLAYKQSIERVQRNEITAMRKIIKLQDELKEQKQLLRVFRYEIEDLLKQEFYNR